jgi:hypothetical protein
MVMFSTEVSNGGVSGAFSKKQLRSLLPSLNKILGMLKEQSLKRKREGAEGRISDGKGDYLIADAYSHEDDYGGYHVTCKLTFIWSAGSGMKTIFLLDDKDLEIFIKNLRAVLSTK